MLTLFQIVNVFKKNRKPFDVKYQALVITTDNHLHADLEIQPKYLQSQNQMWFFLRNFESIRKVSIRFA